MGGVYENDYVKEDGIWKLKVDHVINSYFVTYDGGWTNAVPRAAPGITESRSEEHTSELQSLMRISYAVFCLKKKNKKQDNNYQQKIEHTTENNIENSTT